MVRKGSWRDIWFGSGVMGEVLRVYGEEGIMERYLVW
jgi:hypothetical protein